LSSSVISLQTVFIILGQNIANQTAIQPHHINITHIGIQTLVETVALTAASYIALSGQIAFATSLAQCAKDNNAAENIKGIVNKLLIDSLSFFIELDFLFIEYFTKK
jgi:hypothetical protein